MPEARSVHIRLTTGFKLKFAALVLAVVIVQLLIYHLGKQQGLQDAGLHQGKRRALVHEVNEKSIQLKQQQGELVRISKSAEVDRLAAEQYGRSYLICARNWPACSGM